MATGILSPVHIAFLLVVVLMLFGAKRLPEIGKSLGTGLRGFKDSLDGIAEEARPPDAAAAEIATQSLTTAGTSPPQQLDSVREGSASDTAA